MCSRSCSGNCTLLSAATSYPSPCDVRRKCAAEGDLIGDLAEVVMMASRSTTYKPVVGKCGAGAVGDCVGFSLGGSDNAKYGMSSSSRLCCCRGKPVLASAQHASCGSVSQDHPSRSQAKYAHRGTACARPPRATPTPASATRIPEPA